MINYPVAALGIGLTAFTVFEINEQNTAFNNMNNSFMEIVDEAGGLNNEVSLVDSIEETNPIMSVGKSIVSLGSAGLIVDYNNPINSKCAGGKGDTFMVTQPLTRFSSDVEGLRSRVMHLFDSATSSPWGIFSKYDFHASIGPGNYEAGNYAAGKIYATFLICRKKTDSFGQLSNVISDHISKAGEFCSDTSSSAYAYLEPMLSEARCYTSIVAEKVSTLMLNAVDLATNCYNSMSDILSAFSKSN